jgi:hypothetical protein
MVNAGSACPSHAEMTAIGTALRVHDACTGMSSVMQQGLLHVCLGAQFSLEVAKRVRVVRPTMVVIDDMHSLADVVRAEP